MKEQENKSYNWVLEFANFLSVNWLQWVEIAMPQGIIWEDTGSKVNSNELSDAL